MAQDLQNRIHDSQSRHRYFYDIVPLPYVSSALKLSPRQIHILHKSGLKPRYSPLLQYHTAIHAADVMMTTVTWGWRMPGRTWTGLLISQHRKFLDILGLGILSLKLQPSFMTCWPVGSLLSLPISSLEIDLLWISHSSGCSCPSNWEILGDIGSVVFFLDNNVFCILDMGKVWCHLWFNIGYEFRCKCAPCVWGVACHWFETSGIISGFQSVRRVEVTSCFHWNRSGFCVHLP